MAFDVGKFDYTKYGNNPGRNVFGNADISAARGQGASNYQIRQLMQRANQEKVGVAGISKDWVQRNAPRPEWNYGGTGYWGFGMKDVDAIGDLETVKRHRDWAAQNRLNIGPGVNDWIQDQDDWNERIADVPTAAELMAEMPTPKIRAGKDYATTGRSAQGMRIKKGTKFAEGGKRGTKGYFGRGAKFTGDTAPAMNIKGGGSGSTSQASNTLNTV